jgi:hypothetical protein
VTWRTHRGANRRALAVGPGKFPEAVKGRALEKLARVTHGLRRAWPMATDAPRTMAAARSVPRDDYSH